MEQLLSEKKHCTKSKNGNLSWTSSVFLPFRTTTLKQEPKERSEVQQTLGWPGALRESVENGFVERTRIPSCLETLWSSDYPDSPKLNLLLLAALMTNRGLVKPRRKQAQRRAFEARAGGRLWRSVFLLLFRKKKAEVRAPICSTVKVKKKKQNR